MECPTPDLDQLALAMAHWLDAADALSGDRAASSRALLALQEAQRRLAAHHRALTPTDAWTSQ
jgi:hypothetical protein